jgi:hypothetical protein
MQPNAPAGPSTSAPWNRDIDEPFRVLQQAPDSRSAPVTNDRPLPASEGCRHPSPLRRNRRMTYGVDTPVHSVQPSETHSPRDAVPAQPNLQKLLDRQDAVLPNRNPRDLHVGTGAFVSHIAIKAPIRWILPLSTASKRRSHRFVQ